MSQLALALMGDLRELDLETSVKTNGKKQVPEMSHSCALNK